MKVNGLDEVILGVEDIEAGRRFYKEFGLEETEAGQAFADFETRDGSRVALRRSDDAGLPAAVAPGSTIREIVWGVQGAEDLEVIAAELSHDRLISRASDGVLRSVDDDGYGLAFRVERRRRAQPAENRLNIFGAEPGRGVNKPVDFHELVRPAAMAHVVLFTPDVERATRFYTDRLGFRVSDRFRQGRGAFLRASNSNYHHTLFLIQGPALGLHHVAFHVTDFNDVMMGGIQLLGKGWTPQFGPGRHIIGSNYFWYFQSPCGGAMELTADMDRVDDTWVVRDFDFVPQNTAAWSTTFNKPLER